MIREIEDTKEFPGVSFTNKKTGEVYFAANWPAFFLLVILIFAL